MKVLDVFDGVCSSFIILFSIVDIKDIISIIILVIQCIYILARILIGIYSKIKNNKVEEIPGVIEDVLDEAKDKLDGDKNGK